jgi:DNA primase large subunit
VISRRTANSGENDLCFLYVFFKMLVEENRACLVNSYLPKCIIGYLVIGDNIQITKSDMAKYPFLPQVRTHIAKSELDIQTLVELPSVRERAKQRIIASFDNSQNLFSESKDVEVEIASFPLAILYISGACDRRLLERFSLFEAQRINAHLREEKREDVLLEIAKALKWNINYDKNGNILVFFNNYLESTSKGRLTHVSKWKLVNRALDEGWVHVTREELGRLLQEDIKKRIENLAKQELINVPQEIKEDIEIIKKEFIEKMPEIEEYDQVIKAQESEYPPCITYLMKRATKGEHLSHTERFTFVTYLLHQGVSVDSIVLLFSHVSDFKESKTRYQVENLAGMTGGRTQPYTTYNCDTLQTHGVCKNPTDPICRKIRNPLTYHLRKKNKSETN